MCGGVLGSDGRFDGVRQAIVAPFLRTYPHCAQRSAMRAGALTASGGALTRMRAGLSNTELFSLRASSRNETHLSAFENTAKPYARLSSAAQDARRTCGPACTPRQGTRPACRVSIRLRLPRAARIQDDPSVRTLRNAARNRGRWFLVAAMTNGTDRGRLLVRVAKKVMKSAVARNRMRRCVKEVFRQQRTALAPRDFLVSLIQPYREASLEPARRELERLFRVAAQ